MSALGRPWRRWAVAAPAATFLVAVFVLAPGGIPSIGMPSALEVGAGHPSTAPTHPSAAGGGSHPAGKSAAAATASHTEGSTHAGEPGPTRPVTAASTGSALTVVSAPQPVVVTTGGDDGGPGGDGSGDDGHPTGSQSPSPSPTASPTGSGGDGSGDP